MQEKYVVIFIAVQYAISFFIFGWIFSEHDIDHIDKNPSNNKRENLRAVNRKCNMRNTGNRKTNTSGVKGVRWFNRTKKWVVAITVDSKNIHLGYYGAT